MPEIFLKLGLRDVIGLLFHQLQNSKALKKYTTGTRFSVWNALLLKRFEDAFLSSVSVLPVIGHFLPYTVPLRMTKLVFPFSKACTGAGQC